MGDYTNKCVIKLFDISVDLIKDAVKEYISDELHVDIREEYRDVTITIINMASSDVAFVKVIKKIENTFDSYIYADKDITLEECLVEMLTHQGKYISVAESLTGGMIASRICNVSGASKVFYEGMVTYNPASKVRRLHVPIHLIEERGTVNDEVARGMCLGLLSNKEIHYALSTTGIAGPLSDEFNTPIGRVYVAYGDKRYVEVKELNLTGTREYIRETTVNYALFFMLRFINKYN